MPPDEEEPYTVVSRNSLDAGLPTADFEAFAASLYEANQVMNLTRVPPGDCWNRHFYDSLLFVDLIPNGAAVLDIGTGPGFPAWPLAKARPDLRITALDSSSKVLGFLEGNLLPNLRLVKARAEEFKEREGFDVVTGRAVAPLPVQIEISAAFAKVGGCVIPMRSANDLEAIRGLRVGHLGLALEGIERRVLEGTDANRLFPIYRKVRHTPAKFPRPWAVLKRLEP